MHKLDSLPKSGKIYDRGTSRLRSATELAIEGLKDHKETFARQGPPGRIGVQAAMDPL